MKLVKGAVNALVNDPTLRIGEAQSENVVELAGVVLENASKHLSAFSHFSKDLVVLLRTAITTSSNSSLNLTVSRRYTEHMWTEFRKIRITVLPKMWSGLFEQLDLSKKRTLLSTLKEELCLASM